jgi:hypothetical protein
MLFELTLGTPNNWTITYTFSSIATTRKHVLLQAFHLLKSTWASNQHLQLSFHSLGLLKVPSVNSRNNNQLLPIASGASSSRDHFGGTSPFKIQVNFDIPIFEGQIDADALDKWLNMLEGYFSVHNFSDKKKITFALLKALPHVKHWWETYWEQSSKEESGIYGAEPTWDFFVDAVKEQYYPVGNYEEQYMRWTTLRQERG